MKYKCKSGYRTPRFEGEKWFRYLTVKEAKRLQCGQTALYMTETFYIVEVKINGMPKTWKRNAGRIRVPLKYGMYDYDASVEMNRELGENGTVTKLVIEVE